MPGKFPVDVNASKLSWTHLASAYPRRLVTSSVGDNVIAIADTPYYDPVVSCSILGWEFPVLCHSKQCRIWLNPWCTRRSRNQKQNTIWRRIFSTLRVSLTVVGKKPCHKSPNHPAPNHPHYTPPTIVWNLGLQQMTGWSGGRGAHRRWFWGAGAYPGAHSNFCQMLSHPYGI